MSCPVLVHCFVICQWSKVTTEGTVAQIGIKQTCRRRQLVQSALASVAQHSSFIFHSHLSRTPHPEMSLCVSTRAVLHLNAMSSWISDTPVHSAVGQGQWINFPSIWAYCTFVCLDYLVMRSVKIKSLFFFFLWNDMTKLSVTVSSLELSWTRWDNVIKQPD